ncbi:phage tail sheath subtilisin-like domain-containing protein [Thiothrix sp.]|jgi:phage tail sheath gpL-like|uniref:phage tail sheath subtilisin-like domain-containing protein n=1 Tax=Thiothrix sp. TaxID=1032 RepID=UPI00257C9D3D|nr:phage tail sheath subtilisin-like domain-containing protein [Thiothrix sp.]
MSIPYLQIPVDLLVPGGYTEFDSSLAGTLSDQPSILLVGRKTSTGTTPELTIERIQSDTQAATAWGNGSPLYQMCKTVLAHNYGAEIYACAVITEGETDPVDLELMIEALGDERYDYIALAEGTDLDNLRLLRTELDRRWHAMHAVESHAFLIPTGTFVQNAALSLALNSSHFTLLPVRGQTEPVYQWLATLVAIVANHYGNDPATPPTDVELPGLLAPSQPWTKREQNDMLHAGQSTFRHVSDKVYLSYLVTTYQLNAQGENDSAARDFEVPEILKNFRRLKHYYVMRTYSGYKIARDASGYGADQNILDPSEMKGYLYDLYLTVFMREKGWMQDPKKYLDTMIVELADNNDDRINVWDQPTLIGQFRIFANKTSYITR